MMMTSSHSKDRVKVKREVLSAMATLISILLLSDDLVDIAEAKERAKFLLEEIE